MKDILIITNYFPPETGAASNRIYQLAEGLKNADYNISVVTPLPNYPTGQIFTGYKGRFKHTLKENDIVINRLWIYANNSKHKLLRLLAMLSYSFSLIWFFIWHKIPKRVIIQSPPLLVAFTAICLLRSKKRKLILNVSDLWPLAGLELGVLKKNTSFKLLERIERFNYKHANLILGQSEEILTHVKSIFPRKETFLYRNFPDFEAPIPKDTANSSKKIQLVYAGLLGVAQGIFKLCNALDYSNIQFHIYGAGTEQNSIENLIRTNHELDIIYHGEVSRQQLHNALRSYDITLVPLTQRIYGSVPSKIFEYARLGLPILYFGGGEGEHIIKKYELGWIAEVSNYNLLNAIIAKISTSNLTVKNKLNIQKTAFKHFDFEKQLEALIKVV